MIPSEFIQENGFQIEELPSKNKFNIKHKQKFIINNIECSVRIHGFWTMTIFKPLSEINYEIKSIEFSQE